MSIINDFQIDWVSIEKSWMIKWIRRTVVWILWPILHVVCHYSIRRIPVSPTDPKFGSVTSGIQIRELVTWRSGTETLPYGQCQTEGRWSTVGWNVMNKHVSTCNYEGSIFTPHTMYTQNPKREWIVIQLSLSLNLWHQDNSNQTTIKLILWPWIHVSETILYKYQRFII